MTNTPDNPYTPLVLIEEEVKEKDYRAPGVLLGCSHFALIVLAALPFTYCLVTSLLSVGSEGWRRACAFLFVAGYIGLFFRKEWSYWLCAIVSCSWMIPLMLDYNRMKQIPRDQDFMSMVLIWNGIILLLAIICALSLRWQSK
jgi:hypothetical protein